MERFWPGQLQVMVPQLEEEPVLARFTDDGGCLLADPSADRTLEQLARALPAAKIAALSGQAVLPPDCCLVAADTLVVVDNQVLGKPPDAAGAIRQLRLLSGRTHTVVTGLCLQVRHGGRTEVFDAAEQTDVRFAALDERLIQWYVRTGEPFDKAGSYGIQGGGAALVSRIDGCYYNVMGLPVFRLMALLQEAADHFISYPELAQILPWNR